MRIEKERRKVNIVCQDGTLVRGFIHINPGERVLDFINDLRKNFIAVTNAEFYYTKESQLFRVRPKLSIKKDVIILNKSAIKWIEEI